MAPAGDTMDSVFLHRYFFFLFPFVIISLLTPMFTTLPKFGRHITYLTYKKIPLGQRYKYQISGGFKRMTFKLERSQKHHGMTAKENTLESSGEL